MKIPNIIFILIGLTLVLGCVYLSHCGQSEQCFVEKISKCETGSKLESSSKDSTPDYLEILGKDEQNRCKILWKGDGVFIESFERTCYIENYEDVKGAFQGAGIDVVAWFLIHTEPGECDYIGDMFWKDTVK